MHSPSSTNTVILASIKARPLQVVSPNGIIYIVGKPAPQVLCRSARNMSNEGSLHTLNHITRMARVRALEVTPPTPARLSASQFRPLGSVHILIVDHYERINDE